MGFLDFRTKKFWSDFVQSIELSFAPGAEIESGQEHEYLACAWIFEWYTKIPNLQDQIMVPPDNSLDVFYNLHQVHWMRTQDGSDYL